MKCATQRLVRVRAACSVWRSCPHRSRRTPQSAGGSEATRGNQLTQQLAAMGGVGTAEAALEKRSATEVSDELGRVARRRALGCRNELNESSVRVDEGLSEGRETTTANPTAHARHGVLREQSHVIKHGATPGRADITERVNSGKSGGDVAALERRGRGSPTSTSDTERKPNLEASDVVERSETVRHLEDMPRENVERGRGGTLE